MDVFIVTIVTIVNFDVSGTTNGWRVLAEVMS